MADHGRRQAGIVERPELKGIGGEGDREKTPEGQARKKQQC